MTNAVCVILGGGLGALLRYLLQGWTRDHTGSLPLGTLIVNLSGAFLMGLVMTVFHEHFRAKAAWHLFVTAGILGGYTTFSGLVWDASRLLAQSPASSAWYLFASFAGGGLALFAGILIGGRFQ